jgi:hypothetical protein
MKNYWISYTTKLALLNMSVVEFVTHTLVEFDAVAIPVDNLTASGMQYI